MVRNRDRLLQDAATKPEAREIVHGRPSSDRVEKGRDPLCDVLPPGTQTQPGRLYKVKDRGISGFIRLINGYSRAAIQLRHPQVSFSNPSMTGEKR